MKDTTVQRICNHLRNEITFGKFKPGERLSERRLTEEYNVSRASIREIMARLASQGYLTIEPNRGAVVTKLSLQDIDITYAILVRCESLAASLTAKNAEPNVIEKLKNCCKEMQDNTSDSKIWLQLNDVFHDIICNACASVILIDLIGNMRKRIYRYRMVEPNVEVIKTYNDHHAKIVHGISNKDADFAEKWMMVHLELARKNRFEVFKKFAELL